VTGIDYLSAQLAGLATSLRMMGRDNSADIAQRGAERVEQQARELEELRSAARSAIDVFVEGGYAVAEDTALIDRLHNLLPETEETS